ncbi:MFS transporter [Puerhibacterium sp. TATVAM-FAB25]|uniref:MFS transporter n=1 Tax=Puerhibacterium sp. TATVAM-FAB25 TaxID=3093699 RepID=UPI0039784FAD
MNRARGHRRTRVLLVMAGIWAAAWVLLGLTGLVPGTVAAVVGVLAFHGVFGLGETLLQAALPAVVNDMAPDHLRGRYNAVNAAAFQGGTILGPVAAGLLLQHGTGGAFVAVVVACCVALGATALVLERRVGDAVNGVG